MSESLQVANIYPVIHEASPASSHRTNYPNDKEIRSRPVSSHHPHPSATNANASINPPSYVATSAPHSRTSSQQKPKSPSQGIQRIGPYNLGKTLGVGSSGRVKLGVHAETGLKVAIKIIPKETLKEKNAPPSTSNASNSNTPTINKKIEREITIMKLIRHPHVMRIYDVYETDKELFLVLEHIEGGELFDYLVNKGRLGEQEALMFFQQIILGVEYCHRHLICHRDLKPENLLLDKEMNIKIADFGMASLQVTGKMLETSCGSPHYASPEIIKGIKYDGAPADIWSCGVILYALLTGNLPFDDENIRRLLSKVKSGMYYLPEYLSDKAKDLIKKMLVLDPAKRATMKDILNHPWFNAYPPKLKEHVYPSVSNISEAAKPVDPDQIDNEIIAQLGLLGWGSGDELIKALTSSEPTTEKVFYSLLHTRKQEIFENYDIRKLAEWDIEGGPRRRNESYNSLQDKGSDLYRSEMNLMADMRKSNEELRKSNEEFNGKLVPSRKASEGPVPVPLKPKHAVSASVKYSSPLSIHDGIPPRETKDDSNLGPAQIQQSFNVAASTPELNTTTPQSSYSPSAQRSGDDLRKKLTISIPALTNGPVSVEKNGSPRFHRKDKRVEVPPTPLITQTPKRSWFASLFNFKPEVYEWISTKSIDETLSIVENILKNCDVKVQTQKKGELKCKYSVPSALGSSQTPPSPLTPTTINSENSDGETSKASVKFKIDLVPLEEGTRIQFVQQQGAFSNFQGIVEKIKSNWIAENP